MSQAARKRYGPIAPPSNGLTNIPSGDRAAGARGLSCAWRAAARADPLRRSRARRRRRAALLLPSQIMRRHLHVAVKKRGRQLRRPLPDAASRLRGWSQLDWSNPLRCLGPESEGVEIDPPCLENGTLVQRLQLAPLNAARTNTYIGSTQHDLAGEGSRDGADEKCRRPRRPYRLPMILPVAVLMKCRAEHAGHSIAS